MKKCTSCGIEDIKHDAVIDHSWVIDTTIIANCTTGGYTMERCEVCSSTRQTNVTAVLGHNMVYVTRIEPTYKTDGKIITGCNRCDYEETEVLPKLEYAKIEFDELRLTFGEYSFTEVNNKYSEYHKKPIVKIPVTVENISGSPHSLNMFYYTVFDSSGVESADVGYYFTDDISQGGELLSGKSYTKYFHIVYDGDGVYTIVFDNMLFEKKTVEISVKK